MRLLFLDMDGVIAALPEGCSHMWCKTDFWASLPKYKWSDELVETCCGLFDVHILSSTGGGPQSVTGKMLWLDKHYPHLFRGAIFTREKGLLGAPGRVLVDDDQKNVSAFRTALGISVLFPNEQCNGVPATPELLGDFMSCLKELS